ncbi:MAG TPA: aldehyde dehydrogenase family protein [Solirubrobacterales bacterium]|nr:aldehyde dehydrogenase family protein [Solirubrobacterales bacterium]
MTTNGTMTPDLDLGPTGLLINGSWREAAAGATIEVIAPASEQTLARIAAGDAADVDAAVAAARAQLDGEWSRLTPAERGMLLFRLADLIERESERLARIEAVDVGKPVVDARIVDVPGTVDTFRHFAGWADKIDGRAVEALPHIGRPRHSYTRREPVGVVAAITPWNSPLMIAAWKLAPALAAGCTAVLKPPEDAPLTTLVLADLFEEAGFPAGVLNVVTGLGETAGAALVRHPGVDKISFTGSPEVGREIAIEAARQLRPVTLELGGKSPQVILPDADIEAAVAGTAMGLFANQGEICAAGTRILAAREHYDDVVAGLAEAAAAVRLGDPLDEEATMGALINRAQLDRVSGYIEAGREEGARLVAGGGRPDRPGYFVEPTVFADGANTMKIAREEIFGPVGLVMPFDDLDEAARLANETTYGLAAFIWTRDVSAAHLLSSKLEAGTVWINGFGAPDPRLPWGGRKTSGLGSELSYSGIEENTVEKTVTMVL